MAGIAGLVSAGVGLFGAINGSAPANNVQIPEQYNIPSQYKAQAATGALQGIQGLPGQSNPNDILNQYQAYVQNSLNNPYAQLFQSGANTAGAFGQQGAMGAFGAGQQFQQAGTSMIPGAQQIMNTAFDPQNALYARTQQQVVDQTRAGQAARGVATTPYGAAGESDALRKFDIDWQNAQLGRQAAGAQAAGGLLGDSLKTAAGGSALSSTGANDYAAFGGMPYNAYQAIQQNPMSTLSGYLGTTNQAQQTALNPVQAYLSFLGVGNQTQSANNQTAQVGLNQANLGFNQNQTLGSNLGTSIAGLGNSLSKGSAGFPGATSGWNWLSSFGA